MEIIIGCFIYLITYDGYNAKMKKKLRKINNNEVLIFIPDIDWEVSLVIHTEYFVHPASTHIYIYLYIHTDIINIMNTST